LVERVHSVGDYLIHALADLNHPLVERIRGRGTFIAFDLPSSFLALFNKLQKK